MLAVWTPSVAAGCHDCAGEGSDANYTQAVTAQTSVTVTHNLGKRPAITVINAALAEVTCDVTHTSTNAAALTFSPAFTGTVICN